MDVVADPDTNVDAAVAQAAHDVLVAVYPAQQASLDATLSEYIDDIPDGDAKTNGLDLGAYVAAEIVALRANDHSADVVPYTPGNEPGDWQPTPPGFQPAMLPNWATVTPFAMPSTSYFRGGGPPALGSRLYAVGVRQLQAIGSKTSTVRTSEQTSIAMFWADMPGTITTVGRWNVVARDASALEGLTLEQNARLFALLNVALADAGIVAWDAKYSFNFWRPITAIRAADTDGNRWTTADPGWEPLLTTPAFPEYVSAHSTFSGAAAEILKRYFGTDRVPYTIASFSNPAVTRSFDSFRRGAMEAGASRVYGGIHYCFSNTGGLRRGRDVALYVLRNEMRPAGEKQH